MNVCTGPDLQTYQQWAAERKAAHATGRSDPLLSEAVPLISRLLDEFVSSTWSAKSCPVMKPCHRCLLADEARAFVEANAANEPRGDNIG